MAESAGGQPLGLAEKLDMGAEGRREPWSIVRNCKVVAAKNTQMLILTIWMRCGLRL